MAINCTRCDGTGFLNGEQLPQAVAEAGIEAILKWIAQNTGHDVQVCDCCGNGEDWYGEPGSHYTSQDPIGKNGPYAYNGGLCECH
jgi:hypothetical protein